LAVRAVRHGHRQERVDCIGDIVEVAKLAAVAEDLDRLTPERETNERGDEALPVVFIRRCGP
jgi:hypothetical protein